MRQKKKAHLHQHARKRAAERFGIHLGKWILKGLDRAIQQSGSNKETVRLIGRQTHTRTRFDILVDGRWIPIVYDTKRHAIVTVLPEHELGNLCL